MHSYTSIPVTHSKEFLVVVEERVREFQSSPRGKDWTLQQIYSAGELEAEDRYRYCRSREEMEELDSHHDANSQGDPVQLLLVNNENRLWLINDMIGKNVCNIPALDGALRGYQLQNIPYCYATARCALPEWIRIECPELARQWDEKTKELSQPE